MNHYGTYSDEQLLELLRSGDQSAFTEIYLRYWDTLLGIGYNFSKDTEMAKEVVQEVFLGLWQRRADHVIKNLGAYLATAIKFSVFKQILKTKRRQEIIKTGPAPVISLQGDEAINAIFLKQLIHGQVEKLPEKCRLVFRYSREQGMTIPEIAEEMQISRKTVETHLSTALKTLRHSLKDAYIILIAFVNNLS